MSNLSILIPSMTGREKKLTDLLARIEDEVKRNKAEIIVVLDKSSTMFVREKTPSYLKIIRTEVIGYWRCLNIAIEKFSHSHPFLYTADDIVPDERWLDISLWEWEKKFPHGIGLLCLNDGYVGDGACGHGITTKNFLTVLFGEPRFPDQFEHLFLDTLISDRSKDLGNYLFCEDAKVHHHHFIIGNIAQDAVSKRNEGRSTGDKNRKDDMDRKWYHGGEREMSEKRMKHFEKYQNFMTPELLNQICTYATVEEIKHLRNIVSKKLPKHARIVMIGSGPGVLIYSLLDSEQSDSWKITIIDISTTAYAEEHMKLGKSFISAYIPRIQWIVSDSYPIGKEWNRWEVDLLIIDGDHTELGVRRDMEAWLPHVAENGYVMFHDYQYKGTIWEKRPTEEYPVVKPFADEAMAKTGWPKIWEVGSSAIFQRKIE